MDPLRIVEKKNWEVRVCLDANFFSTVHHGTSLGVLADSTESRTFTAFLHNGTLYQFKRVPFDLKIVGSGFIRALDLVLGNELSELMHLERLFQKLLRSRFTLSLGKSRFFCKQVEFLGYILTPEGKTDPNKIKVITDFPCPADKRLLQSFLGVCWYYRRFSVRHANYLESFHDLLKDGEKWVWTDAHSKAFKRLKHNFNKAVTLYHYLLDTVFNVQTDASDVGRMIHFNSYLHPLYLPRRTLDRASQRNN